MVVRRITRACCFPFFESACEINTRSSHSTKLTIEGSPEIGGGYSLGAGADCVRRPYFVNFHASAVSLILAVNASTCCRSIVDVMNRLSRTRCIYSVLLFLLK